MPQEFACHNFKNIGFGEFKFSEEEMLPIVNEINDIKNNFKDTYLKPANNKLAGNIEKEFFLKNTHTYIEQLILPLLFSYDLTFDYVSSLSLLKNSYPLVLDKPWVNFQKKGEFNPNHNHGGVLSFVLYISVPYTIEEELKNKSGDKSNKNVPAHFEFTYNDSLGSIQTKTIPVDKTYENTVLIFPSRLMHCVYPFYTSDEYRVSVSGNFVFDT
jgi:hypothetical protein